MRPPMSSAGDPTEAGQSLTGRTKRRQRARAQQRYDQRAVRVGGVVLAVLYLVVAVTYGPIQSAILTGGLVLLLWLGRSLAGDRERLTAAAVTAVAAALLIGVLAPARVVTQHPVQAVSYALLLLAWIAPFVPSRAFADRGVTVALGQLGVLATALLAPLAPQAAGLAGAAWILALMIFRGPGLLSLRLLRGQWRSGVRGNPDLTAPKEEPLEDDVEQWKPEWVEAGVAAEIATAAELRRLPAAWTVLHSRALPGTRADVDHVAIGPAGVVVLDSKDWTGKITERVVQDPDSDETWTTYRLNGREDWLIDRLEPVAFEARRVAWAMMQPAEDVSIAVVFTDRLTLPQPVVRLAMHDVWDGREHLSWDPVIHLMHRDHVVEWVQSLPERPGRRPTRLQLWRDGRRGISEAETVVRLNDRYRKDLALVADWVLPPKT